MNLERCIKVETKKRIEQFKNLLESEYHSKVRENVRLGKNRVTMDFSTIARFDPELAQDLLDYPDDTLDAGEVAIKDMFADIPKKFRLRIRGGLPGSTVRLRDLRKNHVDKFVTVDGIIDTKTDMGIQATENIYECPSCGNHIKVVQVGELMAEPTLCSCGRKNRFKVISTEYMDCFTIRLQETSHSLKHGADLQTKSLLCKEDLTDIAVVERLIEGVKINVNGIYRVKQVVKGGVKQTKTISFLEVNYIQISEESYYDIEISQKDVDQIIQFSKEPDLMKRICDGVFQGVHGKDNIKEALVLLAFGGVSDLDITPRKRGEINILLVGDSGENKTVFLEFASKFIPKSGMAVGKNVSEAGLRGTIIKDELTGEFVLKPGVIPLSHNGVCMIDELNRLPPPDREILIEPMESQSLTVTKAVRRKFHVNSSFLMTMNPKHGFFTDNESIYDQIDLPSAIIDRIDMIFVVRRNNKLDDKMIQETEEKARTILCRGDKEKQGNLKEMQNFIMKYIAYARQNIRPEMDNYLKQEYIPKKFSEFVNTKRKKNLDDPNYFFLSVRYLASVIRLAEARRRSFLDNHMTTEDIDYAISKINDSMKEYAVDITTGKIDHDWIEDRVSTHQKKIIEVFNKIFNELESLRKDMLVSEEDLFNKMEKEGFTSEDILKLIENFKKRGDLFFPKTGFVKKIK